MKNATFSRRATCAVAVAVASFAVTSLAFTGTAAARTPFPEGFACAGRYGHVPEIVRVAGNFMGGRRVRPHLGNPRDTRAFQSCFNTVEACQRWVARLNVHYPLSPQIATCVPVQLGGPRRSAAAY
jgi:hypothetical protein